MMTLMWWKIRLELWKSDCEIAQINTAGNTKNTLFFYLIRLFFLLHPFYYLLLNKLVLATLLKLNSSTMFGFNSLVMFVLNSSHFKTTDVPIYHHHIYMLKATLTLHFPSQTHSHHHQRPLNKLQVLMGHSLRE